MPKVGYAAVAALPYQDIGTAERSRNYLPNASAHVAHVTEFACTRVESLTDSVGHWYYTCHKTRKLDNTISRKRSSDHSCP